MVRLRFAFLFLGLFCISMASAQPWLQSYHEKGIQPTFKQQQDAFYQYFGDTIGKKGSGWKQFKRIEWFQENRVNEQGFMNSRGLIDGWREWNETFGARSFGDGLDESAWTSIGPTLTQPYYVGGLGRLNAIEFHPTNPDIIYVGAASGGVWKTLNHGQTWTHLTEELPLLGVAEIVVNPEDPDIVYLASGDRDASDTYSLGVLKSEDGGLTWNETGLSYEVGEFGMINGLQMSSEDTDLLVTATNAGIYRTTNGGDSWTLEMAGTNFKEIDAHPTDGDIFLACRTSEGIYRSTNGGDSWTELTNGLPGDGFSRITLDYSEADPDVIYALYSSGSTFYAVYKSEDGGDSWEQMATTPNLLGYNHDGDDDGGQAWYDLTIAADPNDVNTVYTGGINIWKSTDGGETFEINSHWWGDRVELVHADQHCLDTNGDVVYACHDGGINYTTNGGATWTDITDGLVITQSYCMGMFAGGDTPDQTLIGNQDNGTNLLRYDEWTSELGGDGMECAVHPTNPDTMYGELYYGSMSRTFDGGETWEDCNNGADTNGPWVTPFIIDPDNPSTLYKGTSSIYRSTDNASTWEDVTGYLGYVYNLALAPSNTDIIYASDHSSHFYSSSNGGNTWETQTIPSSNVSYLAVDPEDPDIVYATIESWNPGVKVLRTVNGGSTWTNISGDIPNLPAHCIVVHPDNPDHLYVGMEIGVVYSPDGGETWEDWSDGLPNTIVTEMELHQPSNTLVCCTFGRGMWQSPAELPGIDPEIQVLSPNGGEEFMIGFTYELSWNSTAIYSNVSIEINDDYPDGDWETIVASTENDGSYDWTVEGNATDNARIRISTVSMDPQVSDVSNASFSLINPSLHLTRPNGGETCYLGYEYDITWESSGVEGSLRIQLRREPGGDWETLFDDLQDTGLIGWTPEGDEAEEATIRISAVDMNPILIDESNTTFSIVDPHLAIAQPNGGEEWTIGSTYSVIFDDNLGESISILLFRDGEQVRTIVGSAPSEFIYEWAIPENLRPDSMYTVRISSTLYPGIQANSAAPFSLILERPVPLEPPDGEVIVAQPVHIEWSTPLAANTYNVQVAYDSLFTDMFADLSVSQNYVNAQNLDSDRTFYWRVKSLNTAGGSSEWSDTWSFSTGLNVDDRQFSGMPETYSLAGAYPNPFNPTNTIVVALPEHARLKVQVFNINGERVKTLASGPFPPGYHRFIFDGAHLSSGTYFVRAIVQGKLNEMARIQLVR